jgi:hypothetical protein
MDLMNEGVYAFVCEIHSAFGITLYCPRFTYMAGRGIYKYRLRRRLPVKFESLLSLFQMKVVLCTETAVGEMEPNKRI